MKRKIGLKELHGIASVMKWYDFKNYISKELYDLPATVNSSELTDKLFLTDGIKNETDPIINCATCYYFDKGACRNENACINFSEHIQIKNK